MAEKIILLIPVFNDWESLRLIVKKLELITKNLSSYEFSVLIINDGSTDSDHSINSSLKTGIVHLHRNLGHQKAIAIGLSYIHSNLSYDKVIIMDADGEDNPEDINNMLELSKTFGDKIIVARRKSRQEGVLFRSFYFLYKLFFLVLTGRKISFGNFMLLPSFSISKLVYYSEIWSHLGSTIIKSGLAYKIIDAHRGKRLHGQSKMNFTSLLLHGMGALSVFIDVIIPRLMILAFGLILTSITGLVVIMTIRSFTYLAIPGWASTLSSSVFTILLQSFFLSVFTLFIYQSSHSQRKFIPAKHYADYIHSVDNNNR